MFTMSSTVEQFFEIPDANIGTISEEIINATRVNLSDKISAVKETTQQLEEADGIDVR